MRIDRMLSIIILLLNRDRISARELAEKFEVSIRTIYRDLDAIDRAGVPIISYEGNTGGYGLLDTFKMDRHLFTFEDMMSVLSALRGINTTLDDPGIDSAIEKITSLVPKDKSESLEKSCEQVVIDVLPLGYTERQRKVVRDIHEAIACQRLMEFLYLNSKGEKTRRCVEPMTLIFKGYAWYLFGFCKLKEDFRLFRLSRMRDLHVLEETFVRKEKTYEDTMKVDLDKVPLLNLVLKFAPPVQSRVEDFFDERSITYQDDGFMIVRVAFPVDEWIISSLLSYGNMVEVLEPPEIRDTLKKISQKMLEKYQR